MDAKAALKLSISMGELVAMSYLEDLTDEEMMHRPAERSNHIKWQLGHLISSENQLVNGAKEGAMPDLPDGFAEAYTKETAANDDASAFHSKEQLMELYKQQRDAAMAVLDSYSDEDFDAETGIEYAPTIGAVFSLLGSHYLMHAGQWAVIRRQLGREPLF